MSDLGLLKPICLFEKFFHRRLRLRDVPYEQFADFSCFTDIVESAVGSAVVIVGDTRVICGIKVKVLPRLPDESTSFFICNVEHLGLAYRGQRINQGPSKELQSLSVKLERLLSNVVVPDAKNQLQIYSEEDSITPSAVYLLHVDIGIMLDNGCLLDASLAAAIAALESATWPRLLADPLSSNFSKSAPSSLKVVFKEKEPNESVKLIISERPVALSFAVVPQSPPQTSHVLISQPSKAEFQLWDTDASPCHIVLDSQNRVVDFSLVGGAFCSPLWQHISGEESKILQQIVERASEQVSVIRQQLVAANSSCK